MELRQQEIITTNMLGLINNTICTTSLLASLGAAGVLSVDDQQSIVAPAEERAKSKRLYESLLTRTNSYPILVDALKVCRQSGAVKILENGLPTHFPKFSRDVQQNSRELQSGSGSFSTDSTNLNETDTVTTECIMNILPILTEPTANQILKDVQLQKKLVNMKNNSILNIKQNIRLPDNHEMFVRRVLCKRIVLNRKECFSKSSDIFVFKGGHTNEINAIVKDRTVSSESQINRITCNYILLNDDKDLVWLLDIARNKVLHLLFRNHDEWVLQFTTGNIDAFNSDIFRKSTLLVPKNYGQLIKECNKGKQSSNYPQIDERFQNLFNNCVKPFKKFTCNTDATDYVEEIEIIECVRKEAVGTSILVCGVPGMGKTCLFKKIATELEKKASDTLVVYESLAHFSFALSNRFPSKAATTSEFFTYHFGSSQIGEFIHDLMNKSIQQLSFVFLLDGYDDVEMEQKENIMNFVKELNGKNNLRLCIATKPNFRSELEKLLQVISYEMLQFTKSECLSLWAWHWIFLNKSAKSNQRNLKKSKFELMNLAEYVSNDYRDFPGEDIFFTPRLCLQFANVHYERFTLAVKQKDYRKYLSKDYIKDRLAILLKNYEDENDAFFEKVPEQKLAKHYQIWKALECNTWSSQYAKYYSVKHKLTERNISVYLLNYWLGFMMQSSTDNGSFEFTHTSFVPYLIAKYVADDWKNKTQSPATQKFIVEDVLKMNQTKWVCLKSLKASWDQVEICTPFFSNDTIVWLTDFYLHYLEAEAEYYNHVSYLATCDIICYLILCCARANLTKILKLVHAIAMKAVNSKPLRISHNIFKIEHNQKRWLGKNSERSYYSYLLNESAKLNSSFIIHVLLTVHPEVIGEKLAEFCRNHPTDLLSPIITAIYENSKELVDYVSDLVPLVGKQIIPACIRIENNKSLDSSIRERKDIIDILRRKTPDFAEITSFQCDIGRGSHNIALMNHIATPLTFDNVEYKAFNWTQIRTNEKLQILKYALEHDNSVSFTNKFWLLYYNEIHDENKKCITWKILHLIPNKATLLFLFFTCFGSGSCGRNLRCVLLLLSICMAIFYLIFYWESFTTIDIVPFILGTAVLSLALACELYGIFKEVFKGMKTYAASEFMQDIVRGASMGSIYSIDSDGIV